MYSFLLLSLYAFFLGSDPGFYYVPAIGDRTLYLYDIKTDEIAKVAKIDNGIEPSSFIESIAKNPRTNDIYFVAFNNICVLDVTDKTIQTLIAEGISNFHSYTLFSPDGEYLYCTGTRKNSLGEYGFIIEPVIKSHQAAIKYDRQFHDPRSVIFNNRTEVFYSDKITNNQFGIYKYDTVRCTNNLIFPIKNSNSIIIKFFQVFENKCYILTYDSLCKPGYDENMDHFIRIDEDGHQEELARAIFKNPQEIIIVKGDPANGFFAFYDKSTSVLFLFDAKNNKMESLNLLRILNNSQNDGYPDSEIRYLLKNIDSACFSNTSRHIFFANNNPRGATRFFIYCIEDRLFSKTHLVGYETGIGGVVSYP